MTTGTGRNDLCPCGSGKKYKKCCLVHPRARIAVDFSDEVLTNPWTVGQVMLFPTAAFAGFYSDNGLSEAEVRFRVERIYRVLSRLGWLRGDPRNIVLDCVDDASAYTLGSGPPSDDTLCGLNRDVSPLAIPAPPGTPTHAGYQARQVVVIIRRHLARLVRRLPEHTATPFALKMLLHELTHAFGVVPQNDRCGARTQPESELLADAVVFESLPPRLRTLDTFEIAFEHINAYIPELATGVPPIEHTAMREVVRRIRQAVRDCSADEEFDLGVDHSLARP